MPQIYPAPICVFFASNAYLIPIGSLIDVWKNLGDGRSISSSYFDGTDRREIVMRPTPTLKSFAAQSVILASIILGAASVSHAQTPAGDQGGAPISGQDWGDAAKGKAPPQNRNPASTPDTPDQASSSSGWSSEGRKSGSCRYSTPDQESFLCKIIRIFYGPDTPAGPNKDMDENISAGGAGG